MDKETKQPCSKCGQIDNGQTGEYPCSECGLPLTWDDPATDGGLTLEELGQVQRAIAVYYATSDQVERGKMVYSQKAKHTPEFFVCHPDDLELIKATLNGRPAIHLRDWKPDPVMAESDQRRVKELFRGWAARYGVEV